MRHLFLGLLLAVGSRSFAADLPKAPDETCPRPEPSSQISEPVDLYSQNGVLNVDLALRNQVDSRGRVRYCYVFNEKVLSPTLRVHPGDLLILRLKNDLKPLPGRAPAHMSSSPAMTVPGEPCGNLRMTPTSTNIHFHGLAVPPICHQDDVLRTSIQAGDPPFEYQIRIPDNQPPGLYWYHPHLHGFTAAQVVGGASGAIVVEGIERVNRQVAAMPERVIMIRDEDLLNPTATPVNTFQKAPPALLDRDGDARNTGDGSGTPTKDLSVNFVSVPFPSYRPATLGMRPSERQFWRIVNASSITYLNLQLLFNGKPQALGIVAVDGSPVNSNGHGGDYAIWQNHLGVPPAGRVEFIVPAPPPGVSATLITRTVNTGPDGENDPTRPLINIVPSGEAAAALPSAQTSIAPAKSSALPWLGSVTPVRTRKLYFSEQLQNPNDPHGPVDFFLTVEGQKPVLFDPSSSIPNITVRQGDVEDWIIENRSQEVHDFHIHQIHFVMLEWFGLPINEPFLRDTIPVPFWDGKAAQYPTVKLRMDFRDANVLGLFPFHCHLLEHEDGGMMGLIRVEPAR